MDTLLEVKGLTKKFKGFTLDNVSFTLNRGYIMGLIGPNGAGKSTVIKLIMNLLLKDQGEIKIFGKDYHKNEKEIKNRIGFVYDENYYYEDLRIDEMRKVVAPFYKKWNESTFQNYIKQFQLRPDQRIKELSKGMKMKFSLAIALSHGAELIVMDEPTSGLDPIIRNELLEILYELIQDENVGVLFSTHITTDLDRIADYITFMNKGRLLFSEPKDEVIEKYRLVKGGNELINDEMKKEFIGIQQHHYGFEGLIVSKGYLDKQLRNHVIVEKPTLEEIMLYTVRGNKYA